MINRKAVTNKVYYFDCTDLMRLLSGFMRGMNAYFNSMLQFGPKIRCKQVSSTHGVYSPVNGIGLRFIIFQHN